MSETTPEDMPPVDVGAIFAIDGEQYRITNIWIDEDGVNHLTISHGTHNEKVDYDDLVEAIEEDRAERVNGGHDAYQWRQQ